MATTFPTKHLPPVTYREMPEPLPLRKVPGPGVIAARTGLASGAIALVIWVVLAGLAALLGFL